MRSKLGGGLAGHNGLKSLGAGLGGPDFWRVRAGRGAPRDAPTPRSSPPTSSPASASPRTRSRALIEAAADEAERLVEEIAAGAGAKDEADASPTVRERGRPRATDSRRTWRSLTSYSVDEAGVALLRLEREEARNAINTAMLEEMLGHLASARDDEAVRVLVISSNDHSGLSAGADVREELDAEGRGPPDAAVRRLYDELTDFPKPTVAACHGSVVGGGAEIAVACDLRVAAATCG